MTKNKDFKTMNVEYEKSIKNIEELIEKYTKNLNSIRTKGCIEDYQRCTDILRILYEEKMQLLRISNTLKNYYNDNFRLKDCV